MIHTGRLGRKHLTLAKQVAMIQGHGASVLVFPVLQCPCLLQERQFNPNCLSCGGTGRYYPAHTSYGTTLLLQQESSKRTFNDPGSWTEGTIQATVLPDVHLCDRDKIRLVDITDVFTDEVLTRGVEDRVRFSAGVELLLVADLDRVYRPALDYVLTAPNTVTWLTGGLSPAFLGQYSVKYAAQPEYLVMGDSPRLRIENRLPQSQEVILMRLDRLATEDA